MDLKTCGCGRSPLGKCMGWHALSESEYLQKLNEYVEAVKNFEQNKIKELS